jgi:hypothetical protein
MNSSTIPHVLVGASVLMVHLLAQADATASADMTDVTIRLIDLDPSDGITPWITFPTGPLVNVNGGNLPTVEVDAYDSTTQDTKAYSAPRPFGPASLSAAVPGATAFASYAGDPSNGGANFHSTASAIGGGFKNVIRALADDMMSYNYGPGEFILSPETELVMTAAATTQAETTTTQGDGQQDLGYASASIQLSGTSPDQLVDTDFIVSHADPFDSLPNIVSNTAQLTVTFSNTATSSDVGYYFANTSTEAQSGTLPPPPPVSEPATLELFLGGLCVFIGWRLCRAPGIQEYQKVSVRSLCCS